MCTQSRLDINGASMRLKRSFFHRAQLSPHCRAVWGATWIVPMTRASAHKNNRLENRHTCCFGQDSSIPWHLYHRLIWNLPNIQSYTDRYGIALSFTIMNHLPIIYRSVSAVLEYSFTVTLSGCWSYSLYNSTEHCASTRMSTGRLILLAHSRRPEVDTRKTHTHTFHFTEMLLKKKRNCSKQPLYETETM